MLVIDFEKMVIEDSPTITMASCKISAQKPLKEQVENFINNNPYKQDINIVFELEDEQEDFNEEDFLSTVNRILIYLFEAITDKSKGRKREYRLDVPASFFEVNVSRGMLKRAVNYQTSLNRFNVIVQSGLSDLFYTMLSKGDSKCEN